MKKFAVVLLMGLGLWSPRVQAAAGSGSVELKGLGAFDAKYQVAKRKAEQQDLLGRNIQDVFKCFHELENCSKNQLTSESRQVQSRILPLQKPFSIITQDSLEKVTPLNPVQVKGLIKINSELIEVLKSVQVDLDACIEAQSQDDKQGQENSAMNHGVKGFIRECEDLSKSLVGASGKDDAMKDAGPAVSNGGAVKDPEEADGNLDSGHVSVKKRAEFFGNKKPHIKFVTEE